MQIIEIVDVRENPPGMGIVLQIEKDAIDLIEFAFWVNGLFRELISVGFANLTGFVGPGVPNVGTKIMDVVRFFLPNPKQFVQTIFEIGFPNRQNGQFLLKVVLVDDAEFLNGVSRGSVFPVGPNRIIGIPDSVLKDILDVLLEDFICGGHAPYYKGKAAIHGGLNSYFIILIVGPVIPAFHRFRGHRQNVIQERRRFAFGFNGHFLVCFLKNG